MRQGKMDRYPKRNKKILPEHAKMELGKEKLSWRSNWQETLLSLCQQQVEAQGKQKTAAEWGWQVSYK